MEARASALKKKKDVHRVRYELERTGAEEAVKVAQRGDVMSCHRESSPARPGGEISLFLVFSFSTHQNVFVCFSSGLEVVQGIILTSNYGCLSNKPRRAYISTFLISSPVDT